MGYYDTATDDLRRSFNDAVAEAEDTIGKLIRERDEARAEAARLRAAVEGADEEIGEGDWVCIVLGHARVERIGDRTDDGVPIIGFGHEAIGLVESIPLALTEDVKVIRIGGDR